MWWLVRVGLGRYLCKVSEGLYVVSLGRVGGCVLG